METDNYRSWTRIGSALILILNSDELETNRPANSFITNYQFFYNCDKFGYICWAVVSTSWACQSWIGCGSGADSVDG